jgi:N utilization substance protein B
MTGQQAAEIQDQFRIAQDFSKIDEDHFERLLHGVTARNKELDKDLQAFLDRPIDQVDLMEHVVLLMGAWELQNCPELPYRVVVDEAVDLARRFGSEQGHSFVNAVLDKAARAWRTEETGVADQS